MTRHADDWHEPDPLVDEQRLRDMVRVRGYAMLVAERLATAQARLHKAVESIEIARRIARARLVELREETAHAEQLARLLARSEPDEIALIAQALETIA